MVFHLNVFLSIIFRPIVMSPIQSVLEFSRETEAMKVKNMARLERTERVRAKWKSGDHLKSRTAIGQLNSQLCIECIADVVIRSRLEQKDHDD